MDPLGPAAIAGQILLAFWPVWIGMALVYAVSIRLRRRLGLYGRLFESGPGMLGFGLVLFWALTAISAGVFGLIQPQDPLAVVSGMRNAVPGTPLPDGSGIYLLGGDALARDIFSRMVAGSVIVLQIAPLATIVAFMAGIVIGLPAGYFGGMLDSLLSFLANLVLAFPVILLFYLLVTPEIITTGIPSYLATVLLLLPLGFVALTIHSRFRVRPAQDAMLLAAFLIPLGWLYLSFISQPETPLAFLGPADLFDVPSGILVVFVSVVFVNAPTVFRIVRGLTMDLKTRDYVAAARTRGEGPWYVMLWEILPNARGPLIVDACLRVGYTTILLGTLGFFGLGLPPESPDWGATINYGKSLIRVYPLTSLVPAVALLSLVLGLNLLADALREESLKD